MQPEIIQVMQTQVDTIYRALTGEVLPEPVDDSENGPADGAAIEEVTQRFVELEAAVRSMPSVAEHVPPFSFTPPLDVIAGQDAVIFEVIVPGVEREDVTVKRDRDNLVITGIRRDEHGAEGRSYHHTETPRGPFQRVIALPAELSGEPRVELERGVLKVHLAVSEAVSEIASKPATKIRATNGDNEDDDIGKQ